VSPTVLWIGPYRFFFFSREEPRPHIHVVSTSGEAKIWLIPGIEVARASGMSERELRRVLLITEAHRERFLDAWQDHFGP